MKGVFFTDSDILHMSSTPLWVCILLETMSHKEVEILEMYDKKLPWQANLHDIEVVSVSGWKGEGYSGTYMAPIFLCIRLRSPVRCCIRLGNWKQVSQEDPTHSSASA